MATSPASCRTAASRRLLDFTYQHFLEPHPVREADRTLRSGRVRFDGSGQVRGDLCDGRYELGVALHGADLDVERKVTPVGGVAREDCVCRLTHETWTFVRYDGHCSGHLLVCQQVFCTYVSFL